MARMLGIAAAGLVALSLLGKSAGGSSEEQHRTIAAKMDQLKSENNRLVSICEDLELQLAETVAGKNDSQKKQTALENLNKKLKENLSEAMKAGTRFESEKCKLENEKHKLEDEKRKLENEKCRLEDEKNKLENEKYRLEDEKNKLENEKHKLEDEKCKSESERKLLREKLNIANDKIQNMSQEWCWWKQRAKDLSATIDSLGLQLNSKGSEISCMAAKLLTAESDIAEVKALRKKDQVFVLQAKALKDQNETLQKEVKSIRMEMESEKSRLQSNLSNLTTLYNAKLCEISRLCREAELNADLKRQCDSYEREIQVLKQRDSSICEEIAKMYTENQALSNSNRTIEQRIAMANKEIMRFREKEVSLQQTIRSLETNIETLKNSAVSKADLDNCKRNLSEKISALTKELAQSKATIIELEQAAADQELLTVSQQLYNETKDELTRKIANLENQLDKQIAQNRRLEQKISETKKLFIECDQLKQELDTSTKQFCELRQEFDEVTAALQAAKGNLKEKGRQIEAMEGEHRAMTVALEESKKCNNQQRARIQFLVFRLDKVIHENELLKCNCDIQSIWDCLQEEISKERQIITLKVQEISNHACEYYEYVIACIASERGKEKVSERLSHVEEELNAALQCNLTAERELKDRRREVGVLAQEKIILTRRFEELKACSDEQKMRCDKLKKSVSSYETTIDCMKKRLQKLENSNKALEYLRSRIRTIVPDFRAMKLCLNDMKLNFVMQFEKEKSALKMNFSCFISSISRLQIQYQNLKREHEASSECVMCLEGTRQIILQPCKHFCLCENCASAIRQCPVCRTKIERRIKVFLS